MNPYSPYEYLSFILPGGTILFAAVYGYYGWPWGEPGASGVAGLLAASFIVGNVNAALGTWLEPLLWGRRPGRRPDPTWGLFGRGGPYTDMERTTIEAELKQRYGDDKDLQTAYQLAYTELQHRGRDEQLKRLNQQIGFYRGMTIAGAVSLAIETALWLGWRTHLLPEFWIPLLLTVTLLFAYRYRRFWRWFGDYVIRGVRVLAVQGSNDGSEETGPEDTEA